MLTYRYGSRLNKQKLKLFFQKECKHIFYLLLVDFERCWGWFVPMLVFLYGIYKEEEEGGGVAGKTIIKYNLGLPPNQRRVVRPEENWIKDIDPFDKYLFIFTASV